MTDPRTSKWVWIEDGGVTRLASSDDNADDIICGSASYTFHVREDCKDILANANRIPAEVDAILEKVHDYLMGGHISRLDLFMSFDDLKKAGVWKPKEDA